MVSKSSLKPVTLLVFPTLNQYIYLQCFLQFQIPLTGISYDAIKDVLSIAF